MIYSERERAISEHLRQHRAASTEALAALCGTSLATARRDLNAMALKGLLEKKHGGAEVLGPAHASAAQTVLSDQDPHLAEKDEIAAIASGLVNSGDTIFLGAGKTCTLLARYIRNIENVKVVTTNINAIVELSVTNKASMLLLGGDIHVGKNYIETLDEYTLRSLEKFYFDKVFLTVDAVDMEYGYSITYRLQLMLYEYLMLHSAEFHMMMGKSKFGKRAFIRFCDMKRIPSVITNPDLDSEYLDFFRDNGIRLVTE